MDHVVKAFEFYHLSPENIEQRAIAKIGPDLASEETERGVISPLRQAIINEYQDAGMLLVPMVQAFHSSLAKNFHPLQYSHLLGNYPHVGNSVRFMILIPCQYIFISTNRHGLKFSQQVDCYRRRAL